MMIKLRLLDSQEERFSAGVVITAYTVIDGRNRTRHNAVTKQEAERVVAHLAALYPKETFYVI